MCPMVLTLLMRPNVTTFHAFMRLGAFITPEVAVMQNMIML